MFLSNTNHEEDQPVHLRLIDPTIPIRENLPRYGEPARLYCPAGVYEVVYADETRTDRSALRHQRPELRALQDLRHQGSRPEHHLDAAGGRRRTQLSRHVSHRRPKFALFSDETETGGSGGESRLSRAGASLASRRVGQSDKSIEAPDARGRAVRRRPDCPRRAASAWPPLRPRGSRAAGIRASANRAITSPALIASADRDSASAEAYYREALRIDPRNPDLLERTFAAALSNGDEQTADMLGGAPSGPRPDQQSRAPGDRGSRHRAGTIRRRANAALRRDPRSKRRDGGASDGLDLCRSGRPAPRARHARPHSGSVRRRLSRL